MPHSSGRRKFGRTHSSRSLAAVPNLKTTISVVRDTRHSPNCCKPLRDEATSLPVQIRSTP
eukprot:6176529-Pleurochrysis_carterae.AAC.2